MFSRVGRSTSPGDAIARYGCIAKALHILCLADEPGCRCQTQDPMARTTPVQIEPMIRSTPPTSARCTPG
ncbi:hypothetical protein [Streptomyces sp. NPDC059008]|uniref:hypothetical protein n=1 Tax=Streptomyces sp. NPDC059008 TaxID=3346693 RepID=UPI0036D03A54